MTSRHLSRRDLLLAASVASAATALGCAGQDHSGSDFDRLPDDTGIAFLQNILFLQAEALSIGVYGVEIGANDPSLLAGRGPSGPTEGGASIALLHDDAELTHMVDELIAQLKLLRGLNGTLQVSKPRLNLAADTDSAAASGASSDEQVTAFLQVARKLIDLGASFLLGSVQNFQSADRRSIVARMAASQLGYGAIFRARLKVRGANLATIDDSDAATIAFSSATVDGLAVVRSPSVPNAYLTGSTSTGRFFPNGLNTLDRLP